MVIKLYNLLLGSMIKFGCFSSLWVFYYVNLAFESQWSAADQQGCNCCLTCTKRLIASDKTRRRSAGGKGNGHGTRSSLDQYLDIGQWSACGRDHLTTGQSVRYRVSAVSAIMKDNRAIKLCSNFAVLKKNLNHYIVVETKKNNKINKNRGKENRNHKQGVWKT